MKQKFFALLLLFILAAASEPGISGQVRPFAVGEVLTYEGKVSKIIQGIAVADLTFKLTNAPNSDNYLIKAEAKSKGSLLKIFRYSFLQQYESTVDLYTFQVLKTSKHDVQKERVRDSLAVFDYRDKRVSYTETDPKDPNRPPRRIASAIGEQVHDMISAIYAIRMMPLSVGKKFELTVSDSGLVYKVPVTVTAREQQHTALGKVWCFRVEPEVFGKDRLIDRAGKMIIWMTDDTRHTPVRSQIKTEWGKFDIKLKSSSIAEARTK